MKTLVMALAMVVLSYGAAISANAQKLPSVDPPPLNTPPLNTPPLDAPVAHAGSQNNPGVNPPGGDAPAANPSVPGSADGGGFILPENRRDEKDDHDRDDNKEAAKKAPCASTNAGNGVFNPGGGDPCFNPSGTAVVHQGGQPPQGVPQTATYH